jgi:CubicO group peptidase (beta-lactamase class C family)
MIASLTKQFTAMSILILQEQGKLNVQDRFCTYYPDCPAAWQDITIHQLLTHTSGIPTYTQFPAYPDWAALPKTPDEIIAFFINEPLLFRPGESWTYSNSGYTLLGYLIEHLSGLSYGDFLKTYIFTPLQMDDSGYDPAGIEDIAVGYYDKSNEPAFKLSPSIGFSDGGIYSTVGDLYRWDQALYTEQLLPQSLLDQMFTPYGAAFDSPVPNYGYGWMIEEQDGHRVYFHQGAMDGFKAYIMRFPDDRITLIILSNQMDVTAGLFSREFASEMLSTLTK